MENKLAVFCPNVGARSETFIRRHIEGLLPNRTVIVSFRVLPSGQRAWEVSAPLRLTRDFSFEASRYGRYLQRLTPRCFLHFYYGISVFDWLKSQQVNVMLGQYLHQSWPFIKLARENDIRFFAHAHGYDLSKYWRRGLWRHRYADFRYSEGVIVVNKVMRRRMLEAGVPEAKVHIVPYGVSVPETLPARPASHSCRLLAVGRMVGKKDPVGTLTAFRMAHERCGNLTLDYVGAGPKFAEAQAYVREHALQDVVRLHGGQPHDYVLNLMRTRDAFVQHSIVDPLSGDEEGVPVAILEALAHGIPVISTYHAGIPEAVEPGVSGFLVKEGDIEGMARAISDLANSPAERTRMGMEGWRRAKENFTWEVEKDRLREIMGL